VLDERFCQMTGYTADELLNQDGTQLSLPKEFQELMNNQNKAVAGHPGVYEVQIIQKNGQRKRGLDQWCSIL